MAISTPQRPPAELASGPFAPPPRLRPQPDVLVVAALALLAIALAEPWKDHLGGVPTLARGLLASLVLFYVCGAGASRLLVPRGWGVLPALFAVPIGATTSGLALTALGLAHVPLHVSLWVVLAGGVWASVLVRRRSRAAPRPRAQRRELLSWLAVLALVVLVASIPALRTGQATIYGENPDAHQVVGTAVLFQHVAPSRTDPSLPVDVVPPSWRFRYPIFYTLAGASNLAHLDPIRVFPAMAAAMLLAAALGFGAFAVRCLRAPPWAGPAVAAAVGLAVIPLHMVWHPYWNQLWGFAILPYALLFGWCAIESLDPRCAAAFAVMLVMLGLAYPLAFPYPLVIVGALAIVNRRRLRMPRVARSHRWVAIVALLVLAPAIAGALIKLGEGVSQIVSAHSSLWQGDVTSFFSIGSFAGTGDGVVPALAVLALAIPALAALPRRTAWAVGGAIAALLALDLRLRLARTGAYMDFKHLSFVSAIVIALAATTVARLVSSGRSALVLGGLAAALAWTAAAAYQDHIEIRSAGPQVTPAMFQIRDWASRLPHGASVRVDIPASGVQLWAVYMLGDHPVDAPEPVLYTTYSHAPWGWRADYSLGLRYYMNPKPWIKVPVPPALFAKNPPLFENSQFVLRRIAWPARYASFRDTSSTTLVEP